METFQIPSFYVLHKGGYSILRQCPPGRFFIPRLCRCVVRRLATVPWPVQTTRSLAATDRPLPTTFLPVTIEERSPPTSSVSTVNPMVTNSFAVSGGGFNLQSNDLFGNDDSIAPVQRNRSRRLLRLEEETLKSSQKSSLQSSSNKKRGKSRLKSRRKRKNRKTDKTMKNNRNRDKTVGQQPTIIDKMLTNIPLQISEPPKTSKELRKIPFGNILIVSTLFISKLRFMRIILIIKFRIYMKEMSCQSLIRFGFVEPSDQAPCNPYFRFVFDRTYLSEDKSVPSSPSNSIRFLGVAGSTGETSAYLDGNTSVSVWGMSHITFAPNFQFLARFRLREDYPYEDTFYTLIADGPCEGLPQQYSVTVNPIRREIHSFIKLKNKEELDLLLPDVVSWRVFINCVSDLTIFYIYCFKTKGIHILFSKGYEQMGFGITPWS